MREAFCDAAETRAAAEDRLERSVAIRAGLAGITCGGSGSVIAAGLGGELIPRNWTISMKVLGVQEGETGGVGCVVDASP